MLWTLVNKMDDVMRQTEVYETQNFKYANCLKMSDALGFNLSFFLLY